MRTLKDADEVEYHARPGDPVFFCLVVSYIPESPASQGPLGGQQAGLHMAMVTTRGPASR